MKKQLILKNISYDLYYTSLTNIAEEYLLKSSNSNGDYFLGSDCISVYIYLVEKNKVLQFIDNINEFINQCEKIALPKNMNRNSYYLESLEDFSFIHKNIENSKYDIFISNFDTPMIQKNYDEAVKIHEIFVKKIESISIFSILAGPLNATIGVPLSV